MTLAVRVSHEKRTNNWSVDYNKRYGTVNSGIDTKEKAVRIAKSEAQRRANANDTPVEVKIYRMDGSLQDTVTKRPN